MAVLDQLKQTFRRGSTLARLIYINLAVFILLKIVIVFVYFIYGARLNPLELEDLYQEIYSYLSIPADISNIIKQPWSILTYMFLHRGFLHILFNMLWLYWFGRIFLSYLDSKKLLSTYLLGGLSGALLYILAFNVFPVYQTVLKDSIAMGASASVMAIVIAISVYRPDFRIYLLLIGPVKLKHIAIFTVILDILSIPYGNAGGHIAHLGGALYGFLYISRLSKGKDMARGFNRFMENLIGAFKPRKKIKVTYKRPVSDYEYNAEKARQQDEIDAILDKIAQSGYDSLSKKEKEILFQAGKK